MEEDASIGRGTREDGLRYEERFALGLRLKDQLNALRLKVDKVESRN